MPPQLSPEFNGQKLHDVEQRKNLQGEGVWGGHRSNQNRGRFLNKAELGLWRPEEDKSGQCLILFHSSKATRLGLCELSCHRRGCFIMVVDLLISDLFQCTETKQNKKNPNTFICGVNTEEDENHPYGNTGWGRCWLSYGAQTRTPLRLVSVLRASSSLVTLRSYRGHRIRLCQVGLKGHQRRRYPQHPQFKEEGSLTGKKRGWDKWEGNCHHPLGSAGGPRRCLPTEAGTGCRPESGKPDHLLLCDNQYLFPFGLPKGFGA